MFCIKCGKQNSEKANYCYNCAARLYKPGQGPADLLAKKQPEAPATAAESRVETTTAPVAAPEPPSSHTAATPYPSSSTDPWSAWRQPNQPPPNSYNPPPPNSYSSPPSGSYRQPPAEPPVYRYPYAPDFSKPLAPGGKPYAVLQNPDAYYSYKDKENRQVYAQYATFSQRIVAAVLDTLVMSVPLFILMTFYFLNLSEAQQNALLEQTADAPSTPTWINLLWSTLYLIYCVLLTATKSQTIGKRILGLKVMLAKDGSIPDLQSAFVRNLFGYCWTLGGIISLIQPLAIFGLLMVMMVGFGFTAVALNRQRQGWHDRLAGTVVVHKNEYVKGVNF